MAVNSRKSPARIKSSRNRRSPPKTARSKIQLVRTARKRPANGDRESQVYPKRSNPSVDYNPTRCAVTDLDIPPESRRLVLCDGENVAYDDISETLYPERIRLAYEWFRNRGCPVRVVCPEYLQNMLRAEIANGMEVEFIPNIPEERGSPTENIPLEVELLKRADEEQAAIVSERRFGCSYESYREVVLERVTGFTVFKQTIFIPVDPYGRAGPWLRVILCKNSS